MTKLLLLLVSTSLYAQQAYQWINGNAPGGLGGACPTQDFGYYTAATGPVQCVNNQWTASQVSTIDCKDATGSTSVYTCPNPTPIPASYSTGMLVVFVPQTTNTTTTPTLNIWSMGNKNVKATAGTNVAVGALVGGTPYLLEYDGTQLVQGGGTGTVSSVSFTGGVVTVATPTTTPAFTVAGTSGGLLYFSGASTWASSGVMTVGQFVLGGGAGAAPTASFSVVPVANGGTGLASGTSGGILYYSASGTIASTAALTATDLLIGGGAGAAPIATGVCTIDTGNSRLGCGVTPTQPLHIKASTTGGADSVQLGLFEGSTIGDIGLKVTGGNLGTIRYDGTWFTIRNAGSDQAVLASSGLSIGPNAFRMGSTVSTGADTGVSRVAAGVVGVGNGAAANVSGSLQAASLQSTGTKFTTSGAGCTVSATVGGATAGQFTSSTTGSCTTTITMNGATGITASNGWTCWVNDITTGTAGAQSASSTATAQLKVTTVSGDTVSFGCLAY